MSTLPDPLKHRHPEHEIHDLFVRRWSPRALNGEGIPEATLMRLFEAARWAPSSYNEQEWRFLYGRRETADWPLFFNLLMELNQVWCKNAAALIVVLSKKTFTLNGKPNPVHSVDTGMAVENLMLQATHMGLVAHGMAGFDRDKARADLNVPEDFQVECMIAIGHPGNPDELPPGYKEKEIPTDRKPVAEIARAGKFSF